VTEQQPIFGFVSHWASPLSCFVLLGALACTSESVNESSPNAGSAGMDSAAGGSGGVEACAPKTCETSGAECGSIDDGCGTLLNCGGCVGTPCSTQNKCCPPVEPIDAFDGASVGIVCTPLNALATDSNFAGLDYDDTGGTNLDSQVVSACVGVDFGNVYVIDSLQIHAKIVAKACSVGCTTECGTLNTARVFSGTSQADYAFVATITLSSTNEVHEVPLGVPARYVLVCRPTGGGIRDDIQVDSINSGACL